MEQLSGSAPHQSTGFTPSQVHSASQKVPYKGKDTESSDGEPIVSVHSKTSERIPDERIRDRVTQHLNSQQTYTLSATFDNKPPEVITETPATQQARLALDDKISDKCHAKMQLNSVVLVNADDSENQKLLQTFTLSTNPDKHPAPATPETQRRQLDFQKAISDNVGAEVKLLKADWVLADKIKADLPTQPIQISHQKIREEANKQVQEATVELQLQQNRLAAMTLGLTEETPVGATPYPKSEDNRSREFRRQQALQQLEDGPAVLEGFRERLQSLKSEFGVENFRATPDLSSLRRVPHTALPIFKEPGLKSGDTDGRLTTETELKARTALDAVDSRPTSWEPSMTGSRESSRPASPTGSEGQTGDSELPVEGDLARETATRDRTELEAGDSRHTSRASSVAVSQAGSCAASPSGFDGQTGNSELPVEGDLTRETATRDRTELEAGDSRHTSRASSVAGSQAGSRAASPDPGGWETASEGEESKIKDIAKDSQQLLPPRPDSQAGSRAASPSGFHGQTGDSELPVEDDLTRETATQERTELEAGDSRHTSRASSVTGSRAASPSGFDGQTGDSELPFEDDLTRETATQDRTELEAGDSRHTSRASSVAGSQAGSRAASPSGFEGQTGDSELPVEGDLTREMATQDRTGLEAWDSRHTSRASSVTGSQASSRTASPSGIDEPLISSISEEKLDSIEDGLSQAKSELGSMESKLQELSQQQTRPHNESTSDDFTTHQRRDSSSSSSETTSSSETRGSYDLAAASAEPANIQEFVEEQHQSGSTVINSDESDHFEDEDSLGYGEDPTGELSSMQRLLEPQRHALSAADNSLRMSLTGEEPLPTDVVPSSTSSATQTMIGSGEKKGSELEPGVTSGGDKRTIDEKQQSIERTEPFLGKQPDGQFVSRTMQFSRTSQSTNDAHISSEVDPMGGTKQRTEATLATGESSLESLSRSQERVTDETLEAISQELRKEHGTSTDETGSKASVKGTPQHQEVFTLQTLDAEVLDTDVTVQKPVITITEEGNESLKSLFSDHEKMEDSSTFEMMTREITTTETTIRETTSVHSEEIAPEHTSSSHRELSLQLAKDGSQAASLSQEQIYEQALEECSRRVAENVFKGDESVSRPTHAETDEGSETTSL